MKYKKTVTRMSTKLYPLLGWDVHETKEFDTHWIWIWRWWWIFSTKI